MGWWSIPINLAISDDSNTIFLTRIQNKNHNHTEKNALIKSNLNSLAKHWKGTYV